MFIQTIFVSLLAATSAIAAPVISSRLDKRSSISAFSPRGEYPGSVGAQGVVYKRNYPLKPDSGLYRRGRSGSPPGSDQGGSSLSVQGGSSLSVQGGSSPAAGSGHSSPQPDHHSEPQHSNRPSPQAAPPSLPGSPSHSNSNLPSRDPVQEVTVRSFDLLDHASISAHVGDPRNYWLPKNEPWEQLDKTVMQIDINVWSDREHHVAVFLKTGESSSVQIDETYNGQLPNHAGALKVSANNYVRSRNAAEVITLVIQPGHALTVANIISVIINLGLDHYRFVDGKGCRHWVHTLAVILHRGGLTTEASHTQLVQRIGHLWNTNGIEHVPKGIFVQAS